MANQKRHYKKRHGDKGPRIESQPRDLVCCLSCGLPKCWHGDCINEDCRLYVPCSCQMIYGGGPAKPRTLLRQTQSR